MPDFAMNLFKKQKLYYLILILVLDLWIKFLISTNPAIFYLSSKEYFFQVLKSFVMTWPVDSVITNFCDRIPLTQLCRNSKYWQAWFLNFNLELRLMFNEFWFVLYVVASLVILRWLLTKKSHKISNTKYRYQIQRCFHLTEN